MVIFLSNSDWKTIPRDVNTYKFTGNYIDDNGIVKTYLGFWYHGDGNIWIAKYYNEKLNWVLTDKKKY